MPLVVILLLIAVFGGLGAKVYSDRLRRVNKIISVSNQNGIDPALSLGIAEQENKFQSTLSSDKLSAGIFQIKPSSAGDVLGYVPSMQELISDEDLNIKAGVLYIKMLFNRYNGNLIKTIAAYNHGIGNVDKGLFASPTDEYVRLVSGYKEGWSSYLENA